MNKKIKLLLAEDEPNLAQIVKESLESRDFEVYLAKDGVEAMDVFTSIQPNILVLDVMMPKKDGFTLAKEIRLVDKQTPIIFLTSKSQTSDVVEGFQHGGNDYLKKPFSMEELIVRVNALLNRTNINQTNELHSIGGYTFDYVKQLLCWENQKEQLTHREADLLFHLYNNKNEVLERNIILKKLWGNNDFFNARSMDVFITKLRKKLQKDPNIQIINVRGVGYKLIIDEK